jgi:subtilisin-like proprotein convertase family protein
MNLIRPATSSLALLLMMTAYSTAATVITETFTKTQSAGIPDGDLNGLLQTLTPAATTGILTNVTVTLEIAGGWNGDLYAYLWHDGNISVLLNRIGRSAADPAGSSGTGLSVTFDDEASTDIHQAVFSMGNPLLGTFQPDDRLVNPLDSLDTTPRQSGLSVFDGGPASGDYRLFIVDAASGDTATLTSWSISLSISAIPEPSGNMLMCCTGFGALVAHRRRKK